MSLTMVVERALPRGNSVSDCTVVKLRCISVLLLYTVIALRFSFTFENVQKSTDFIHPVFSSVQKKEVVPGIVFNQSFFFFFNVSEEAKRKCCFLFVLYNGCFLCA